ELIAKLNPVIRGWSNYFRTVVSKETYSSMDHHLWNILWQWATRRHPNKSGQWIAKKYWTTEGKNHWEVQKKW
ncbi:MAG: group II intron reverse transcriptase/maturase, partial [Hormoscilla sp. SP5CHS1]|nr:group II intron reverse transcriptase/maturase [Hormoscilla sp. SP5CHS1]